MIGLLTFLVFFAGVPEARVPESLAPQLSQDSTEKSWLDQAYQAIRAGDVERALEMLSRAIDEDPKSSEAYWTRGSLQEDARRFERAEQDYDQYLKLKPKDARGYLRRGSLRFFRGNALGSIKDFDQVAKLSPEDEPHLWQRGLSHYYAKKFDAGKEQFVSHRRVNGNDVENSAWHYLCVAKAEGIEAAKEQFLTIERGAGDRFPDTRPPMEIIYGLFAGHKTVDDVLEAAGSKSLLGLRKKIALMYAHLYVGLYYEVSDKPELSRQHIKRAVDQKLPGNYMWEVARVHQQLRG